MQSFQAEGGVEGVSEYPGQDEATMPVNDSHQVHEATGHGDVGNVGRPDEIRAADGDAFEQVRVDLVAGCSRSTIGVNGCSTIKSASLAACTPSTRPLPFWKTAAPSVSSCFFHRPTWLGCSPCSLASWLTVFCSLTASKATLNLNWAVFGIVSTSTLARGLVSGVQYIPQNP
jgi:hypothetical protein